MHDDTTTPPRLITILLVEDNDCNRDMLARRLERKGYHVQQAATGAEALALARTARPRLILLDLRLPDLDGWQISRTLKVDPATRAIPIIAASAHVHECDRERALAAGCDDYQTKPIDFPTLLEKMKALIGGGDSP